MSRVPPAPLPYRSAPSPGEGSSGMAVAAMVLGIVSLVTFCISYLSIPAAITAIVLGIIAKINISRGSASGNGMALTGIILGIIALALDALLLVAAFSFLHYGAPKLQQQLQQMQQYLQQHPPTPTNPNSPTTAPTNPN